MKLLKKKSRRHEKKNKAHQLITLSEKKSPISEQYRTIRTNLQFSVSSDNKLKSITITSGDPGEGKSTTAANLAVVYAEAGYDVLLIDADMRRPTIAKTFRLLNLRGLSNVLSTEDRLKNFIQKTDVSGLSILVSGPNPPNPAELLNSRRFDAVLDEVKKMFDIVLIDVPAFLAVADAQIVASKTDGTVLIISENMSRKDNVLKTRRMLTQGVKNLVGVIYNNCSRNKSKKYYY